MIRIKEKESSYNKLKENEAIVSIINIYPPLDASINK